MYCITGGWSITYRAASDAMHKKTNDRGVLSQMLHSILGASRIFRLSTKGRAQPVFRRGLPLACGLFAALFFLATPLTATAQRGIAISYLADSSATLTIEKAASPEKAGEYRGYVPSFMVFSSLPETFNGAVWLRIALDSSFEKPVTALRVDMGASLPGITRLFIPHPNGTFAVMESPPPHGIFTLPENAPFPDVLYARVDGTPGLWFRPFIGAVEDSPLTLPLHFILAGIFAAAMLLLLVQYIRKAEEWRLWAAITAGCGIVGAILPPTPIAGAAYTPLMATAMLMPGLALVFFAHTTRHLFDSPKTMPGYDTFIAAFYLIGGAIALLPLVPGFIWVARYLPFTGILLLPLLPICMVAMSRSLRGCSAYFCACLLPVLGVAASAWELTATDTPLLAGTGGLWGFALAMLVLALTPPAKQKADATAEDDVFDSLNRSAGLRLHLDEKPEEETPLSAANRILPEDTAMEEPGRHAPMPSLAQEALPETAAGITGESSPQLSPALDESPATEDDYPDLSLFDDTVEPSEPAMPPAAQATEAALPIPDSEIAERPAPVTDREEAAPEFSPFKPSPVTPPTASQSRPETSPESSRAAGIAAPEAARRVEERAPAARTVEEAPLSGVLTITEEEPEAGTSPTPSLPGWSEDPPEAGIAAEGEPVHQDGPAASPAMERRRGRRMLFNLPLLIKNAFDTLAPLAEAKNCSMTWFIAPQTGRLFEGEAELLESALQRILRDMAGSVERGNVRLTVRRLPDSAEPGHLVFTIVEWDAKLAAHERNIEGHAEAWALAEKTGGIFSVEHSPSGTTVIFSAVFTAMDAPKSAEAAPTNVEPAPSHAAPRARDASPANKTTDGAAGATPVFTDHPDIAMPADHEAGLSVSAQVQSDVPPGIDGDGLADDRETERAPDRIIIADIAASSRAKTAGVFKETPYSVLECTSPPAAHALYTRHPAALVIMNADMPEVDIAAAIKDIHADDEAHGRHPVASIALVGYAAQASRMMQAGCTRTVLKSQVAEELLGVVEELVPLAAPPTEDKQAAVGQNAAALASAPAPETRLDAALTDIPPVAPGSEALPATAEKSAETTPPMPETGIFASVLPPSGPEPEAASRAVKPEALQTTATASSFSGPGLGLLDMIVTDEDEDETPEAVQPSIAPPPPAATLPRAVTPPPAEDKPADKQARAVRVTVKPRVKTAAAAASPAPSRQEPRAERAKAAPMPETAPPAVKATVTLPGVPQAAPGSSAPVAPVIAAEKTEAGFAPAHATSIPLSGEDDGVFKDMLPLVPGLIIELSDAMADAARGREEKSPLLVQEASERVAGKAASFGLTRLERMARCVERAAAADDIEPMECVLADLEAWVDRYKEALEKLHREAQW